MKRNKMMRLASVLMVATLLSTSVISGTFAKYTTSKTGGDSARVAQWGVQITANGQTFASSYANHDAIGSNAIGTVSSVNNLSGDGKNLLAPGTVGEFVECVLAGSPEVAVEVKYESTVTLTGWTVTGDFDDDGVVEAEETDVEYCPIVFTVDGTEIKMDATNDTLTKLKGAVEAAINAYTAEYDVNEDLSDESNVKTPDVTWSWPFNGDDMKDTCLGVEAAAGSASEITVSVKTTVTQID